MNSEIIIRNRLSIPNFDRRLLEKQVDELFHFVPSAILFSLIGAIATLVVFVDTGNKLHGMMWFAFAVVVMFIRGATALSYGQQQKPVPNPRFWANMMIASNVLAGVQWGLIGTVFFPETPSYRELFSVLVITSYVAGSITAFASVKWVHLAFAVPAAVPPAIYVFFMRDGSNWIGGSMALFFVFCVLYFGFKQHALVETRLALELESETLLHDTLKTNKTLHNANSELQLVTTVERRARSAATDRAALLKDHVDRTLLPVIECDRDFKIVAQNNAAETLLGYRFRELSGQFLSDMLMPSDAHARDQATIERAIEQDRASTILTTIKSRSGKHIPARLYVTPMHIEGGAPMRVGVIIAPYATPDEAKITVRAA